MRHDRAFHGRPRRATPPARAARAPTVRRPRGSPRTSASAYEAIASGRDLREPADRALAQPCEIAHVDPGRGRDLVDRRLDEVLGRVNVRRVEHAEHVLVDPVELHQLLVAGHHRASLGLLAEIRVAAATATGDVRLGAFDRTTRALGTGDAG